MSRSTALKCRVLSAAGLAIAGLFVTALSAHAQQSPLKIGYVDGALLLANAPGKAAAESTYASEATRYDAELHKLQNEIDSLAQDYTKHEGSLTAAQKDARQKAIAAKQKAAQDRANQLQQKLAARSEELQAPLREAVKKVLDEIRVEEGYSIILSGDKVLSADKNLDITERALLRLKTLAAKRGPQVSPAGGTAKPPVPRA